jgi:tetratricopeptide (TPR) repeat protein
MSAIDPARWGALEPLLDQALELAPDARARWLSELAGRSPELAADLAMLLAQEAAAEQGRFLAGPLQSGLAGHVLGAYRLERPLGQGGMGSVWLARRADGRFDGTAAVKILNLALVTAPGQERFRREGSVLARLSHPGIARLLDAGVGAAGEPYLVIEHVDGVPIDRFVVERALALEARLRLFLQVVAAVEHAHAHLVVHRDLKPSNILVTADGTVKLLDFGIAKLLDDDLERTALTQAGGQLLTPRYAAPEQVKDQPLTTATDVYALGVLLYLLISGRHPTGGKGPGDAIRALLEDDPGPLGLGDLDTVLAKALRKDPSQRYQTVAAFGDDLERYLRREPVSAQSHSLGYRLLTFLRRNQTGVAVAAVVLIGLLGATVVSLSLMQDARRQRDAAVRERLRADAQVDFQNFLLSNVGDRPMAMREVLDTARAMLLGQWMGDPRIHADLLLELAGSYKEFGEVEDRRTLVALAESLALASGDSVHLARARCDQVDLLRQQGRYPEAWAALPSADGFAARTRDPGTVAACHNTHAQLADETGRHAEAATFAQRAVAIMDSVGTRHGVLYLDYLTTLAGALDGAGHPRQGVETQRRAMAVLDSAGRHATLDYAIMEHNLAMTLVHLGEVVEAESLYYRSLVRFAKSDPSGRLPWQVMIHYAETALIQAHDDSAARYFTRVVRQAVADSSRYWEGRGLFGLGRVQARLGRLTEARDAERRLAQLAAADPRMRETDGEIPDERVLRGWIAIAAKDPATARAAFLEAIRANGFEAGRNREALRPVLLLLAGVDLELGRADEALELARQAAAIARLDSLTEIRSAALGEARLLEARALLARGDTAAGRLALEHARAALRFGAGAEHPRTRDAEGLAALLVR